MERTGEITYAQRTVLDVIPTELSFRSTSDITDFGSLISTRKKNDKFRCSLRCECVADKSLFSIHTILLTFIRFQFSCRRTVVDCGCFRGSVAVKLFVLPNKVLHNSAIREYLHNHNRAYALKTTKKHTIAKRMNICSLVLVNKRKQNFYEVKETRT